MPVTTNMRIHATSVVVTRSKQGLVTVQIVTMTLHVMGIVLYQIITTPHVVSEPIAWHQC